ncbi:sulfate permease [Labrys miyagiensis]|uniref:Sulfate permease n=1 Tax=Labrys miyagiensis TaxID=346912 RepID=A0ABQ6CGU2_9HYPH|nr:sulfate permease [Labrys miyagiensis]
MAVQRSDVLAGLSVAGLLVPEAVAYSTIAGLPPQHAVFAAIVGLVVYALLGRSSYAITTATSSSAAILAATVGSFQSVGGADKQAIAFSAVVIAGVVFLVAGFARLGSLSSFVSRPVLRGFAFGLAITIVLKQIPSVLGIQASGDPLSLVIGIARQYSQWNGVGLITGTVALAALLTLRRIPVLPGAFLVLAGGIAATYLVDFPGHHVAIVGPIDVTPELPVIPDLTGREWSRLVQTSVPLALILFAESWGTVRSLALRHDQQVEANRELLAIGTANLISGLVRGMPVGAGFSASSANEAAGAVSRWAGVVAAIGVAILIGVAGSQVARLPEPILAAVVIAAMTHALDPQPLLRLWKMDRDQYVACAAALAVMVLGVLNGMLVAIALSIAATLRRLGSPQVAMLGELGDSRDFVDVARHPEARLDERIGIFRPTEPLFFFNAEASLGQGQRLCLDKPTMRAVILSLEDSSDMDSTALDALVEFEGVLRGKGKVLYLARLKDDARAGLVKAGAGDLAGPDRCFWSVWDAYEAACSALSSSGRSP